MKQLFYLLLLATFSISCSKKLTQNAGGDDSLIGKINEKIKSGTIGEHPLVLLNEDTVSNEDLNLLNEFPLKDFTSIDYISKPEAKQKYGRAGEDGAVIIHPFVDEALSMKYYEGITNGLIKDKIDLLAQRGLTKRNPIIVLDGIPLRGDDIVTKINALADNDIKQIDVLKKAPACRIYGVRAINGVILVTKKAFSEN